MAGFPTRDFSKSGFSTGFFVTGGTLFMNKPGEWSVIRETQGTGPAHLEGTFSRLWPVPDASSRRFIGSDRADHQADNGPRKSTVTDP